MKTILRQGDVLLVQVEHLPDSAERVRDDDASYPRRDGIILAFGEATGHAPRITAPTEVAGLWDAGAERFLQVIQTVALKHEEHLPVTIAPGIYRVAIQCEYTPRGLMSVVD